MGEAVHGHRLNSFFCILAFIYETHFQHTRWAKESAIKAVHWQFSTDSTTSLLHTALIYETHFQHTRSAKESARLYMGTDQTCFVDMFSGNCSDYQLLLEQVRKNYLTKIIFCLSVFQHCKCFLAVKPPALNDNDRTHNIFTPVHYPRLSMNFQCS